MKTQTGSYNMVPILSGSVFLCGSFLTIVLGLMRKVRNNNCYTRPKKKIYVVNA